MNDFFYYMTTFVYFVFVVIGACVIPSVDEIFEFVATISVNALTFIFPSCFYLMARKKFKSNLRQSIQHKASDDGSKEDKGSVISPKEDRFLVICSYLQITMGIFCFGMGMFNNIHGLI